VRGVILPGRERVEFRELDRPEPGHGQVLVKMKASGLCGSDLRAIYHEHTGSGAERYQNVVAGHEPSGQVEAVGPGVSGFEPDDRVVVYHILACARCEQCTKGFMIGCTSQERAAYGWQRDGGHADYLLAEASTLLHLPAGLTYTDGALVACGFGTAYQGISRADVSGRDTVLVVGLGPVGLGAVMLAASSGAEVIGVDLIPKRLELARGAGATHVLMGGEDAAEECEILPMAAVRRSAWTVREARQEGSCAWRRRANGDGSSTSERAALSRLSRARCCCTNSSHCMARGSAASTRWENSSNIWTAKVCTPIRPSPTRSRSPTPKMPTRPSMLARPARS
jgi:D-arabinose 1-dehydrogenase-like Zn-dependent alcohol dehydrogenase